MLHVHITLKRPDRESRASDCAVSCGEEMLGAKDGDCPGEVLGNGVVGTWYISALVRRMARDRQTAPGPGFVSNNSNHRPQN